MMKTVLISSLGESPGVVTGTLDAIMKREKITINKIVMLHTAKRIIQKSVDEILLPEIREYYRGKITEEPKNYSIPYLDVNSEESNLAFFELACQQIAQHRKEGYEIYLDIAGGRKTMSALVVVAAELIGIKAIYHFLIDDDLVQEGHATNLFRLRESGTEANLKKLKNLLHPIGVLVELPFISVEPIRNELFKKIKKTTSDTITTSGTEVYIPPDYRERFIRSGIPQE